jgi:hypothetical protein
LQIIQVVIQVVDRGQHTAPCAFQIWDQRQEQIVIRNPRRGVSSPFCSP